MLTLTVVGTELDPKGRTKKAVPTQDDPPESSAPLKITTENVTG